MGAHLRQPAGKKMSSTSTSTNTSRDAAENMENSSSAAVEDDSTAANPPSKKPKLLADDSSTKTAPAEPAADPSFLAAPTATTTTECELDPSSGRSSTPAVEEPKGSREKDEVEAKEDVNDGSTAAAAAAASTDDDVDVVDSAVLHQDLKDGDRIQVLWTIESNGAAAAAENGNGSNDDNEEEPSSSPGVLSTSRWWGAALLPWDGSAEQGVAIRTLRYDSYPPDFPEQTDEAVVFAETKNRLVTYPGLDPMIFRRESAEDSLLLSSSSSPAGSEDDGSDVIVTGREGMEQLVDSMLMGALQRYSAAWGSLSAARQAEIAETIAHKKARLLELMEQHLESHDVISATDIQEILARTMAP